MTEPGRAVLREALDADCRSIYELLLRLGVGVPATPAAQDAAWMRLWKRNPAAQGPPGWVLEREDDGRVVGFFGSIALRYRLGARALRVADASHWGVEKRYRAQTPELAAAYFAQAAVDLFLVTTALPAVGRIFGRHGGAPMPLRSYDRVLFWILDPAGFVAAVLRRRGTNAAVSAVAARGLALPLALRAVLPGRRPGRHAAGLDPECVALDAAIDDIEGLWTRKLAERECLYASRAAEDLRWRFGGSAPPDEWTFLRCRREGRCIGAIVLRRESPPKYGLVRTRIVDLLAEHDDARVIEALLAAAGELARERGDHVLEWFGFPEPIREVAQRSHPLARTLPGSPFHFKANDAALAAKLGDQGAWYPSLYDGDSSL